MIVPFVCHAPPGYCPKCVAPRRSGARSCPSCGLVFLAFRPEDHRPPEFITTAWRALLVSWADPKAHRAFLLLAHARGGLVAAARLYRIFRAHTPDDPLAEFGLQEIVRLALAPTEVARTPDAVPRRSQALRGAWAVLLIGAGALLLAPVMRGLLQ